MDSTVEIRILSLIAGLFSCLFGLGIIVFHRNLKRFNQVSLKGIPIFGVGQIFLGIGQLLISADNLINDFLSIAIGNILAFVGFALMTEGLCLFRKRRGKLRLVNPLLVVPLSFACFTYFAYFKPALNVEMFISSLLSIVQLFIVAAVLLRNKESKREFSYLMSGLTALLVVPLFPFLFSSIVIRLPVTVAGLVAFVGLALMTEGLYLFRKRRERLRLVDPLLLPVVLLSSVYFTYLEPALNIPIFISILLLTVQFFVCAVLLLRDRGSKGEFPYLLAGLTALLAASLALLRSIWGLEGDVLQDFMSSGEVYSLTFIVSQFLIVVLSFSLVWMVSSVLQKELENSARLDPLTTVFNRRGLEEMMQHITVQNHRNATPLSIIMADMDRFKKINDTYGHQAGDMVLKQFAATLKMNLRLNDILARYGGEEFTIVLSNTETDRAIYIAEKLRKSIQNTVFKVSENDAIQVTASFGVSTVKPAEHGVNWEKVVAHADAALYEAKRHGRNQVRCFQLPPSNGAI